MRLGKTLKATFHIRIDHDEPAVTKGPYKHVPLHDASNEIRIVLLAPGRSHEVAIHCRIKTSTLPLDESSDYEALSYTWGDTSDKQPIDLDGKEFYVTKNLDGALRYLRDKRTERVLWVDAICIDQADNDEKSRQVQMMHRIYAHARKVLVWLGESDAAVQDGLRFFEKKRSKLSKRELKRIPVEIQKSLAALYQRAWWSRVWVVQEVFFAKEYPTIGCGHFWFSFEHALDVLYELLSSSYDIHSDFVAVPDTEATLAKLFLLRKNDSNKDGVRFYSLLHATASYDATDPRDHVLALLNMVKGEGNAFKPDYAMTTSAVYQQAVVSILETEAKEGKAEFLFHVVNSDSPTMPSWCIDFSKRGWEKVDMDLDLSLHRQAEFEFNQGDANAYNFFPKARPIIRHDIHEGTLHLKAIPLGNIKSIVTSACGQFTSLQQSGLPTEDADVLMAKEQDMSNLLSEYRSFLHHAQPALEQRYGSDTARTAIVAGELWKIIADGRSPAGGGLFDNNHAHPDEYAVVQSFFREHIEEHDRHALDSIACTTRELIVQLDKTVAETVERQLVRIAHFARGCSLFTTNEGYIGRAAHPVQIGDLLCLLHNYRRPAILRDVGKGKYRLITFTWTHGVMQGELFGSSRVKDSPTICVV